MSAQDAEKRARALLKALRELLEYTGGADIADPAHPIRKARIVAGLEVPPPRRPRR